MFALLAILIIVNVLLVMELIRSQQLARRLREEVEYLDDLLAEQVTNKK